MFYDRPLKRWVPNGPPALSAYGLSYAFVVGDTKSSQLHLLDLASNQDVVMAEGGPWRVVGDAPDAIYVMRIEYTPPSPAYGVLGIGRGLWKVPTKGVHLTSDTRDWGFVSGGYAWGGGSTADVAGGPNDIVRFDVQTMRTQTWFAPGKRSRVLAIDSSGVPLIMSEAESNELWRVPAPDAAVKVWSAPWKETGPYAPVAVDGSLVWLSSRSMAREWSIYKYSADKGLELMATFSDHPESVGGPCA
jgi:hypothetical protein